MTKATTRREFLLRTGALGCSLAASPFVTPITLAATPGENRLVVIILRGGLDGLDAVRPVGDHNLATARPKLVRDGVIADLDGYFGLHPQMASLMPMWQAGELGFVHATSTPYRDKRSHFDGQDLLETGGVSLSGDVDQGWLNRMLQSLPDVEKQTAFSIGDGEMLITRGEAQVSNWSPDVDTVLSAAGVSLLHHVMNSDPAMASAMADALVFAERDGDQVVFEQADGDMVDAMQADMKAAGQSGGHLRVAKFAAAQLRGPTRVATFSIGGWDTHRRQAQGIAGPLRRLSETLTTLKQECGPDVWQRTTVLAMTEFGRTVRENGTGGTDHGTGSAMLLAGGALRGGRVLGDWPGLEEASLYQRRDLMPTSDLRRWAAWAMRDGFGIARSELEARVFPGLDMEDSPNLLL